jgi:hypothetical protein
LRKTSCSGFEIRRQDQKKKEGMNIFEKIPKIKNDSKVGSFCLFSIEEDAGKISKFNLAEIA